MWKYKVNYANGKTPFEDFFIRPFNQLSGYFWYFPLEKGSAYVGAGDFNKGQNEFVDKFNVENPGKIERKIGRPIQNLAAEELRAILLWKCGWMRGINRNSVSPLRRRNNTKPPMRAVFFARI